jgi:hypothetical protein
METTRGFPTPASVQGRLNEASATRVKAVVAALEAAVEREGARRINVSIDYNYSDHDAIRAAVEPAGWSVEFCDNQREWQSIRLTPMSVAR